MAPTRSRSGGREHARPNTGGVAAEHATKIYTIAAVGIVVIIAFLALTSVGHVIDAATQHFMLFYAGVFALIGLCASVGLGLVATDRMFLNPAHRVFMQSAHRAASFGAVTFLVIHIISEILAQRVHVIDAVIPFLSPFRTFYIGLGTIASDLIILLVVTGILRGRFNANGNAWRWRAIHYTSYLSFIFGVWHGLLAGRSGKPYVDWSYGFLIAFVLLGLAVRILSNSLKPKESLSGPPVPMGTPSASAPLRAAAMAAQLSVSRGGNGIGRVADVVPGRVTGGQPVLSGPLGAPVLTATALPAGGGSPAGQGQPYYEPGYEGPPRYLGAPRGTDTGPMARPGTGPVPRAGTGPMPRHGTGPLPRATGPLPAVGPGPLPPHPSGPLPRLPGYSSGPLPRAATGPMQRPATGPMPRAGTGPMPRPGTGPMPRAATGPMPQAGTGPMPRPGTGPMPRPATGPMPGPGTGPMPRAGTGPLPRAATGPFRADNPRPEYGPGTGPTRRPATGPLPQAGAGRPPGWDNGQVAWENSQLGWDDNRPGVDNSQLGWDGTRPGWENGQPGWDGNRAGWDNGQVAWENSQPGWDDNRPGWDGNRAGWDTTEPQPRLATGPISWPGDNPRQRGGSGPLPAAGGSRQRPGPHGGGAMPPGSPAGSGGWSGSPAGGGGWPGSPAGGGGWAAPPGGPDASHEAGWHPGGPPWDSGFPETDPNLRYREPGPGMPGYRGSRDNRYGGDRC